MTEINKIKENKKMTEKSIHSSEFTKNGVIEHNKNHDVPDVGDTFIHEERVGVVKKFNVGDKGIVYLYNRKGDIKRGTNINVSWGKFGFITESIQPQSTKQQLAKLIGNDNNATRPYSITYRRIW